jgi:hypothetical protein
VTTLDDTAAALFNWVVKIEPNDLRSRCHERPGTTVAQREDSFDHILLRFLKDSGLGALLDKGFAAKNIAAAITSAITDHQVRSSIPLQHVAGRRLTMSC